MVKLGRLVEARFIHRLNRFTALVDINGAESLVHVANSGRMRELLVEGRRVYLVPAGGEHRKTAFDLALVDLGHTLASADARLPNKLVHEAQIQGRLECFAGYDGIRLEATYGDSRLDMALSGSSGTCLVEVKSVTLVEGGSGIFPDAPTTRGRKHVLTLADMVKAGYRGAVVFVVQREDADSVSPNDESDPDFGAALRGAIEMGVEAYAFRCSVSTDEVTISSQIPVVL
ncbi:MAG: DNA/RNA nuclease SfsA [Dehalococcoidia bacterium]|nr:DNA/RNA nuclease SfsA [Dehalococcoidia bacterium]